jgi:hypothetical protein
VAFLHDVLVVLHLLGMAAIVGGYLAVLRSPRILIGMVHGALTQLGTGVALVGLAESGALDIDIDRGKIAVKLLVALGVAVLALVNRRKDRVSPGVFHAVGALALLNVLVAVFWS